jgi:hypothetical protein
MKVVINACYGGFSLSPEAELRLYELGCAGLEVTPVDKYYPPEERGDESALGYARSIKEWREYRAGVDKGRGLFITTFSPDEKFVLNARDIPRDDALLIKVVDEMGEAADGAYAKLRVIEIPDGLDYEVSEYDGFEHIAEKHRTWS